MEENTKNTIVLSRILMDKWVTYLDPKNTFTDKNIEDSKDKNRKTYHQDGCCL